MTITMSISMTIAMTND